jgi:hypothetical protein
MSAETRSTLASRMGATACSPIPSTILAVVVLERIKGAFAKSAVELLIPARSMAVSDAFYR